MTVYKDSPDNSLRTLDNFDPLPHNPQVEAGRAQVEFVPKSIRQEMKRKRGVHALRQYIDN
jgi:hypothetical protein